MDTVTTIPIAELSHLHMDPEQPVPGVGDGGTLSGVDAELIETVVEHTVGSPLLSVEIRHLGGAVARPRPEHGAAAAFEAPYIMYAVGAAPPDAVAAVHASVTALRKALEPWEAPHTYMNFADTRGHAKTLFSEQAYHRLRRVKAKYDPAGVIRSNHPLQPTS